MKVELLVNLKVNDGRIIPAGSIFSDESGPIPEFVYRRLRRGAARVISNKTPPPESVPEVIKEEEVEVDKPVEKKKAPRKKKIIVKK
jgi:hypothetical protein